MMKWIRNLIQISPFTRMLIDETSVKRINIKPIIFNNIMLINISPLIYNSTDIKYRKITIHFHKKYDLTGISSDICLVETEKIKEFKNRIKSKLINRYNVF